jgi:TIGR02391 family protein
MSIKRKCFTHAVLEGISKILGDTGNGLTGSEIQHLLAQSGINDVSPSSTKWKRLFDAFAVYQNENKCSNHILNFIAFALAPAKFVNIPEVFSEKRNLINQQLSFIGYQFNDTGKFSEIAQAKTISEAQRRANDLKTKLEERKTHVDIIKYCKAELLANNYFHSVFEANKGLFQRIRDLSLHNEDGNKLIEFVFSNNPVLIINNYQTSSEQDEHKGFCNILKGLCGMFRNPEAHEPKISWEVSEQDALEILSMISYCHRRLDNAQKIK